MLWQSFALPLKVLREQKEVVVSNPAIEKGLAVSLKLREQSHAERLSRNEQGVALVSKAFEVLLTSFEGIISGIPKQPGGLQLELLKPGNFHQRIPRFSLATNHRLALHIALHGLGGNYTHETKLVAAIVERKFGTFGIENGGDVIREFEFNPTFRLDNRVVWRRSQEMIYATEELANVLLEELFLQVERHSKS